MEIIGIRPSSFTASDGTKIEGKTVFVVESMTTPGAEGKSADRIFLTKKKLDDLGFSLVVGMEVEIFYNRFGKVATLKQADYLDID